jgi:hypothetical protein
MRLSLLSGLVTFAGLALFGSSTQAQVAVAPRIGVPSYAPGTVYYSNGYYYQVPARAAFSSPVYRAPVYNYNSNSAMTGRISQSFDPTGRPIQLYKPWLRPMR